MKSAVMIVDDMKLNIDILAACLNDKYTIMPARSGESALKMMAYKKPDIVLLDVFMPDMDGYDVLKFMKMQENLADIPVIFVSGEHSFESEEKGLELGAVDYVKKPYNPAFIKAKIQNILELKSYRDNMELLVKERTNQIAAYLEALIMGMSLMSENHDKETGEHIWRIKEFTRLLVYKVANEYPNLFTQQFIDEIILFSPLHDVGKVCITDAILRKKSALTNAEYETMKLHTIKGAQMLRQTEKFLAGANGNSLKVAIEIAEFHHEKFDGTGYPHGLKGEEIPLSARIVALADVYDALISKRPYKRSFEHREVINILLSNSKRTNSAHFDPKIFDVFSANHEDFKCLYD